MPRFRLWGGGLYIGEGDDFGGRGRLLNNGLAGRYGQDEDFAGAYHLATTTRPGFNIGIAFNVGQFFLEGDLLTLEQFNLLEDGGANLLEVAVGGDAHAEIDGEHQADGNDNGEHYLRAGNLT